MTEKKRRFHGPHPACWQNRPWKGPCLPAKAPWDLLAPHPAWGGAGGTSSFIRPQRRREVGEDVRKSQGQ